MLITRFQRLLSFPRRLPLWHLEDQSRQSSSTTRRPTHHRPGVLSRHMCLWHRVRVRIRAPPKRAARTSRNAPTKARGRQSATASAPSLPGATTLPNNLSIVLDTNYLIVQRTWFITSFVFHYFVPSTKVSWHNSVISFILFVHRTKIVYVNFVVTCQFNKCCYLILWHSFSFMQLIYCSSQKLLSGHLYRPRDYRQGDSAHLHLYISLLFITHYFPYL